MNTKSKWQIAAGTTAGKEHRLTNRNNQDALAVVSLPNVTVATICDGCGSEQYSEVGARIGAIILTHELATSLNTTLAEADPEGRHVKRALERATLSLLSQICLLAKNMGASFSLQMKNHFLFTVVGTIITPELTTIFSLGDGLFGVNGVIEKLGPFPGNYPPYLGYELVRGDDQPHFALQINRVIPTEDVQSLIIGSDGVFDLLDNAGRKLPGMNEILGPIDQFWSEDRYFTNPDNLRRRLTLANREMKTVDWANRRVETEHGLLNDDTTIVVIRRGEEV